MISPDWLNTFRIFFHANRSLNKLGSKNASLNEYHACYDKARRALYRLLENVK